MFRSLAVIPLSVPRSEILKNILMEYQIYPETFNVIRYSMFEVVTLQHTCSVNWLCSKESIRLMLGQSIFHPGIILQCTTPRKNLPSTCAEDLHCSSAIYGFKNWSSRAIISSNSSNPSSSSTAQLQSLRQYLLHQHLHELHSFHPEGCSGFEELDVLR